MKLFQNMIEKKCRERYLRTRNPVTINRFDICVHVFQFLQSLKFNKIYYSDEFKDERKMPPISFEVPNINIRSFSNRITNKENETIFNRMKSTSRVL